MFLLFVYKYWWFLLLFFILAFYLGYLHGKKVTKEDYKEKKFVVVIKKENE